MNKGQTEIKLVMKIKCQIKTSVEILTKSMTHMENSELVIEDKVRYLNHSVKGNEN